MAQNEDIPLSQLIIEETLCRMVYDMALTDYLVLAGDFGLLP